MRALAALVLLLALTACGGDGPSESDKKAAEDFCAREMLIDKYENPDGFDRCVEDAAKVTDCLDTPASTLNPWIPPNCDNNGYMPAGG